MRTDRATKVLVYLVLLIGTSPAFSDPLETLTLASESALWLVGDSSLHPYTSRTTDLTLHAVVDPVSAVGGQAPWDALVHKGALKEMRLTLPVKGLKSKESALDKNMYKALKAKDFPEIVFRLSQYDVVPSTFTAGASQINARGTLTVAGKENPIMLRIDAIPDKGTLHVQGQYSLLMSDYGIKPPTMMLGTIKVRDPVQVHFDVWLIPSRT